MTRGPARTRSRLEGVFNGLDCTLNLSETRDNLQRVVAISWRLDVNAATHSSTLALPASPLSRQQNARPLLSALGVGKGMGHWVMSNAPKTGSDMGFHRNFSGRRGMRSSCGKCVWMYTLRAPAQHPTGWRKDISVISWTSGWPALCRGRSRRMAPVLRCVEIQQFKGNGTSERSALGCPSHTASPPPEHDGATPSRAEQGDLPTVPCNRDWHAVCLEPTRW